MCHVDVFFFFKQKTAYEMRISDWSSDVCSSDLNSDRLSVYRVLGYDAVSANQEDGSARFAEGERVIYVPEGSHIPEEMLREHGFWEIGRASCRERVCTYV